MSEAKHHCQRMLKNSKGADVPCDRPAEISVNCKWLCDMCLELFLEDLSPDGRPLMSGLISLARAGKGLEIGYDPAEPGSESTIAALLSRYDTWGED